MPVVKKFLKILSKADVDFIVFTSRESKEHILQWFRKHRLPIPLDVTNTKVKAAAYIDDRAVYFDGNFDNLIKTLADFKVYWSKEKPFFKLG